MNCYVWHICCRITHMLNTNNNINEKNIAILIKKLARYMLSTSLHVKIGEQYGF